MSETINTEQFIKVLKQVRYDVQTEMYNAQYILDNWHGQRYANQRRAATLLIKQNTEKLKHIQVQLMLLGDAK